MKHQQQISLMWVKTGMSFKCTPEKTVAFKGDQCSGGKKVKRVT